MPPAVLTAAPIVSPIKKADNAKDWAGTFPENMDTAQDSFEFMSRMLYITFAHILQSRKLMPEHCFKKRAVNNDIRTYVMNLKERLGVRMALKFKGASAAMQLGYLDQLMIVVGTNDDDYDDAIEIFAWKMKYSVDGTMSSSFTDGDQKTFAKLTYRGPEQVKAQTRALLWLTRKLCRQLLSPLPSNAFATLRITYTDKTPVGYQAEGFYPHTEPELFKLHEDARPVDISGIATGQHKCLLSVKSIYIDDEYAMSLRLHENNGSSLNSTLNETLPLNASSEGERDVSTEDPSLTRSTDISTRKRKSLTEGDESGAKKVNEDGPDDSVLGTRGSAPSSQCSSTSPDSPVVRSRARRTRKTANAARDTEKPAATKTAIPGKCLKTTEFTPGSSPRK